MIFNIKIFVTLALLFMSFKNYNANTNLIMSRLDYEYDFSTDGRLLEEECNECPIPNVGESFFVTAIQLNLRSSPVNTSEIVTKLNKDSEVKLIRVADPEWWYVSFGYYKGYVFCKYLKPDNTSNWPKVYISTGQTPPCENIDYKYDYSLNNYLKVNVQSKTDVVLKLMKKSNYGRDICIRMVYIRSQDSYYIRNIPEGIYYAKIAYGNDLRKKTDGRECKIKFNKNATYHKGKDILNYHVEKEVIGNSIFTNVPSFELSLYVEESFFSDKFHTNTISEDEFNN
jgi:uncharacterized protein YgiM (DUF1202 family)